MSQNGFIFPNFRGGNKKYLSCHHLGTTFGSLESNSSYVWQTYFGGIGSNLARDADFDRHLSIFLSDRRVCIKEIPRISVCIELYVYIYICMIMIYIYIYKHCLRSTHQQPTTTVSSSCLWRHFHVITGSGRVTLCHNSQQTWVTAVSIACGQAFRQAYFFACNHPTVPSKDCLQTGWCQGVSPPFP